MTTELLGSIVDAIVGVLLGASVCILAVQNALLGKRVTALEKALKNRSEAK